MEAEVLFEYEPTQPDELALKMGTIILNVQQVDDGWCEGEYNGVKGMFPDNFVRLLKPVSSAAPPPSHQPPPHQPPPANEPPSASVPLRNADVSKKIRRAKVSFSYAADNGDELALQPGQIVEVLEEEEEGWWRGRVGNMEGVFPSNFVEEIMEDESRPQQQPARHPSPDPVLPIDLQTGERSAPVNSEGDGVKSGVIRGPMVMPAFDPTSARAKLKKSTAALPLLEKPPEHKKAPPPSQSQLPKLPEKTVEQAKVTFDYDADNEDELTIRVGEMVEVVSKDVDQQEGWWEVSLKGRRGLVPDNFVELLPPQPVAQGKAVPPQSVPQGKALPPQPVPQGKALPPQPVPQSSPPSQPKQAPIKPPLPKEPVLPAKQQPAHPPPPFAAKTTKKAEVKKSPPKEPSEDHTDFPVPKTTPLDTSAVKDRPKHKSRPPSRSNLLCNQEAETSPAEEPSSQAEPSSSSSSSALSPWQAEIKAKKKQPKLAPKPSGKPKPPAVIKPDQSNPQPRSRLGSKDAQVSKPEPPPVARSRANTGSKAELSAPAAKPMTPKLTAGSKSDLQSPPVPAPAPIVKATPIPKPTASSKSDLQSPPAPIVKAAPMKSSVVKPHKPVETKPPPQDTPAQSEPPSHTTRPVSPPVAVAPIVVDNSWKEAYDKLKDSFDTFKEQMVKDIQILTDDLDRERKHRAGMDIDIDRLKKAQRH